MGYWQGDKEERSVCSRPWRQGCWRVYRGLEHLRSGGPAGEDKASGWGCPAPGLEQHLSSGFSGKAELDKQKEQNWKPSRPGFDSSAQKGTWQMLSRGLLTASQKVRPVQGHVCRS